MVPDTIHSDLFYVLVIEEIPFSVGKGLKLLYFRTFLQCCSELQYEVHVTLWEATLLPGSGITQNMIHP